MKLSIKTCKDNWILIYFFFISSIIFENLVGLGFGSIVPKYKSKVEDLVCFLDLK